MMIDRFGRTIQQVENGYDVDGIFVETNDHEQAMCVFNAMAPEGWVEQTEE